MSRPFLTATLIAKNEKHNVARCLEAIWDHIDELVVIDTGSDDGTLGEFLRYAKRRGGEHKLKTGTYLECNDENGEIKNFAPARQAADDLATGEWLVWCDLDDQVRGLDRLRDMAEKATEDVVAFFTWYRYAADEDENSISELWRERVVRNDGTRWEGRLHEHKLFTHGGVVQVDPTIAEWIHHRDHNERTGERNLRILNAWLEDEPDNPRVISSIAMEHMGMQDFEKAADMFAKYLLCEGEPPDRRAQSTRHMCVMLNMQNRWPESHAAALGSLQETWLWADTHLTLAECAQMAGRPEEALVHARTAMEIGKPNTLLIVNPLQYTAHPLSLQAVCLAQLGRLEEAAQMCEQAMQVAPHYPLATQHFPQIQAALRRHRAVVSWQAAADVLVEAGELVKARALLDQAPFYVFEDMRLIRRRSELSYQISERLRAPKVSVVDQQADELIERMAA